MSKRSPEISKHISYREAIRSNTAKKHNIDNTPSINDLFRMRLIANELFEPLRIAMGNNPIHVNSFFRSTELNKKVGGAYKIVNGEYVALSQHCKGEAMDLDNDYYEDYATNKELFEYIKDNMEFDQLIAEGIHNGKIAWVHVSYKKENNRKDVKLMRWKLANNGNFEREYLNYNERIYKRLVK